MLCELASSFFSSSLLFLCVLFLLLLLLFSVLAQKNKLGKINVHFSLLSNGNSWMHFDFQYDPIENGRKQIKRHKQNEKETELKKRLSFCFCVYVEFTANGMTCATHESHHRLLTISQLLSAH